MYCIKNYTPHDTYHDAQVWITLYVNTATNVDKNCVMNEMFANTAI